MSSEEECAALCPVEYPYCYASQQCTPYCWMDDPGIPVD
jgi:hypothetical protein